MTLPTNTLRVLDPRADLIHEPIGLETPAPRLSWRIEGAPGTAQARYRIRAAATEAALASGPWAWDSGKVASAETLDVVYGGAPAGQGERTWWSVEVADTSGASATSEPTWFEAGLLAPDDWHAEWIEAEDEGARADRAAALAWVWSETPLDPRLHGFRLDFDAPEDLARAEVMLSGKDHLRGVWINGEAAALPRPFGFDSALPFWGTLTPFEGKVRAGRNSICALVEAVTEGFFPVDGGAFAALIRLHRAGGGIERLVSGPAWRVRATPPEGWTDPAFDASAWATAVSSGANVFNDPRPSEPAMLLRTTFRPHAPVVAARLYATALGGYDARINGQAVSDAVLAPEITVAHDHLLYQTYDVTALIVPGANALAAIVGDGWYASPFGWRIERYGFGPAPRRFLAQLRLDYADGSHEWVATGPDWRIARSAVVHSEIYDGELFDARLDRAGWDGADFDASDWRPVRIGAAPDARLVAQVAPPLRRTGELRAVAITEPEPGRFVLDFGQNFSGWVRIAAQGTAGTTIVMRFAELLAPDGTADLANLRLARATDTVVLAGTGKRETYEPHFTYHGFRYVEIEGFPCTPTPEDVVGVVVHSDCAQTGTLDFPDAPLLRTIWTNALWSQRSNFFAVPTDCPQRDERMGWTGDIQVFLDAAAFNMDVDAFIRRFLLEVRAAQRPDGGCPIVVPQPLSFPDVVTAGWSEAIVILPWQLWQRYADTAAIDENWAAMEAWMAFVARRNADGIWRHDRELDLGDWLSVDAIRPDDETTPRALCGTAYWAWCAAMMAEMAAATGRDADAARYAALRATIGAAFAAEFVRDDGVAGNGSQTSQVLALHMDLVPADRRAAAAEVLAADIRGRGMTLSTGFLGTPYLLDVLADAGHLDVVEALLMQTRYPSWGYMPANGATTMWERWNGDVGDLSMNSYNHYAFGAVVGFFYRRLAGIAPAAPGFRRIAVRPLWLPSVGRVTARYDSCVGRIETETDGDASGLRSLSLTIPANTVAAVELPARDGWNLGDAPLADVARQDGAIRFEVGPGHWRFTA